MDKNIDFKDNKILVLHNSVIEARYKMSLDEIKLFIALVSLIQKDDTELKEYEIKSEKLNNIFNVLNKDGIYEITQRVADNLMKRIIFIEDKEQKYWAKYSIFSKMEYKDGILHVKFNSEISPYLLKLRDNFTSFKLAEFKPFTSKYSIRIYELLKQYKKIGERTFDIEDLKQRFGIEKGEFKKIIDFKRFVINKAQSELETTPMAFDYQMIKTGRKFTRIKFILKYKQEKSIDETDNDETLEQEKIEDLALPSTEHLEDLYKLIPTEQLTESIKQVIQESYTVKGPEYVKNAIEYVNRQKPKNYLAYLKSTLDNHYSEALEKEKEDEEKRLANERKAEYIASIKNKIRDLVLKRDAEIEKMAKSIFESLPEIVKEQITQLAKSEFLKESPQENVNSTDHIFRARLEIHILDVIKTFYGDKFKDIHEKYDKSINELEMMLKSV